MSRGRDAAAATDQLPEVADPTIAPGAPERRRRRRTTAASSQPEFMRALLRDGLFPAMRVDPVVLRAFLRMFNLLEPPDSLMTNMDVIGRVMTVYQDRDDDRRAVARARPRRPHRRGRPRLSVTQPHVGGRPPRRSGGSAAGDGRDDRDGLAVGHGGVRPSRKRTSSSATNTFTKRRRSPSSSNSRSVKPGCAASSGVEHLGDGGALDLDLADCRRSGCGGWWGCGR